MQNSSGWFFIQSYGNLTGQRFLLPFNHFSSSQGIIMQDFDQVCPINHLYYCVNTLSFLPCTSVKRKAERKLLYMYVIWALRKIYSTDFFRVCFKCFKDDVNVPGCHRVFGVSCWLVHCGSSSPVHSYIAMLYLHFSGREKLI